MRQNGKVNNHLKRMIGIPLVIAGALIVIFLHVNFFEQYIVLPFMLKHQVGTNDWEYSMEEGFSLLQNADTIYLTKDNQIVVDADIMAFCEKPGYIGLRQLDEWNGGTLEDDSIGRYYLISLSNGIIEGPLSYEGYLMACKSLSANMEDWVYTIPKPTGAFR